MEMSRKGMTRRCPICNERLTGISTDWVLSERRIANHQICTIGSIMYAPQAAAFQMASNLAAYKMDFDVEMSLGFRGTAWVQCPKAREVIGDICFPR